MNKRPLPGTYNPVVSAFSPILTPRVKPVAANFAWRNQTSNSVSGVLTVQSDGSLTVTAPAQAGGEAPRMQDLALSGASTWSYTAALTCGGYPANYWQAGLQLLTASTGKHLRFCLGFSGSGILTVVKYDTLATFNSTVLSSNMSDLGDFPRFFQIASDSVNWFFNFSADGVNFTNYWTTAVNTYVVPDRIGFFADSLNASHACYATLLSWSGP